MKHQKQHNPKRFEGLHPSQYYQCHICGIMYISLQAFNKHCQEKHTQDLGVFIYDQPKGT